MSHSSKLMTLRSLIVQLGALKKELSRDSLTIEEYCALFDLCSEAQTLLQKLEVGLVLELDQDEEGHHQGKLKLYYPPEVSAHSKGVQ